MTMLERLGQGLSPVQIASTLARMADPVRLSYEAVYTALYAMPRGQLRASLLDPVASQTQGPQTGAR
jgi:transposase, IS30 family